MNKTKLFILKEPTIRNNDFMNSVGRLGTSPTLSHFDNWCEFTPRITSGTPLYYPIVLSPWDNTLNTALSQDIGAMPGYYTIAITLEENDKFYNYNGQQRGCYCVGIGNSFVWLGPNGTTSNNPLVESEPGTYIFDLVVNENQLNDPIFGNMLNICASGPGSFNSSHPVKNLGIKNIYIKEFTGDYQEVDLYDNINVDTTYNIADVRDISKKDSNYSLTIDIPDTAHNAQLFDLINDISTYNSTFELERSYKAFLEVDNNRTFEGYFKLTKVNKNDNQEISYEGNLYSNVIEFVKRLGTATLRGNDDPLDDLDFSNLTTLLDANEFLNRFTTTNDDFGITIANKANIVESFGITGIKTEQDFVTDTAFPNQKIMPFYYDELTPYLKVKAIWDKIFADAHFNYVSEFLNNTTKNTTSFNFKDIVYPYTGANSTLQSSDKHCIVKQVNDSQNAHIINVAGISSSNFANIPLDYQANNNGLTPFPLPNIVYTLDDNCSGSTLASWQFIVPADGVYQISANMDLQFGCQMKYIQGGATPLVPSGSTVNVVNTSDYSYEFEGAIRIYNAIQGNYTQFIKFSDINNFDSSYLYQSGGGDIMPFTISKQELKGTRNMPLKAGDIVQMYVRMKMPAKQSGGGRLFEYNNQHTYPVNMKVYIDNQPGTNEALTIKQVSEFALGNKFDPTVILNPKTRKIDFVNSIIKTFNLYVEDISGKYDSVNNIYYPEKTFRIEPRDLYYSLYSQSKDWTDRVDADSINFNRIDEYLYKRILLKNKADEEYYVKDYNSYEYVRGEWGEKIVTSPFNVSSDEKTEIATSFGETMVIPINKGDTILEFPSLISYDDGEVKEKELVDRIWFVKTIDVANPLYNMPYDNEVIGLYQRILRTTLPPPPLIPHNYPYDFQVNTPDVTITKYNWCGHLNDAFGKDSADLNFNDCMWYYQDLNGTRPDMRNCYNTFYRQMIEDYNNVNARLMTCKMYLKPSDIRDLLMNDVIIVNSVPYHINKIKEWEDGNTKVEVELIKVLTSNSKYDNGGNGAKIKDNLVPIEIKKTPKTLKEKVNEFKNDVAAVNNLIEQNTDAISKNSDAVTKILSQLKDIDDRLKKLEDKTPENEPIENDTTQDEKPVEKTEEKPKNTSSTTEIKTEFKKQKKNEVSELELQAIEYSKEQERIRAELLRRQGYGCNSIWQDPDVCRMNNLSNTLSNYKFDLYGKLVRK